MQRFRFDVVVVLGLAALSLAGLGPVMRESDQASLLGGALRIATGEMPIWGATSYNYDKLFVSYWLLALVLRAGMAAGVTWGFENLVAAGNLVSAVVFWGGAAALTGWRSRGGAVANAVVFAALSAPAVLLNASLLCANAISGGFLLVLAAVVLAREEPGRARLVTAGVLSFLAVGARADAVLCLPFLAWLTVRRPSLGTLAASRRVRALAAGAILALAAGLVFSSAPRIFWHPVMAMPEVIAAYLIFGAGGGGLALVGLVALMGRAAWRSPRREKKLFWIGGALAALLPLAYFGFQLYTPRHLMTAMWIVLMAVHSERVRGLFRWMPASRAPNAIVRGVVVLAAVPLLVGVQLPAPRAPEPVFLSGQSLYPTADGHWPMGGYAGFLLALRGEEGVAGVDHNGGLWRSLATVDFEEVDGTVPVVGTPLFSYFELAATLQGARARLVRPGEYREVPFVYGDERMLRRATVTSWGAAKQHREVVEALRGVPKEVVSASRESQAVLRFLIKGRGAVADRNVERRLALAEIFEGSEYEECGEVLDVWAIEEEYRGRTFVFSSRRPFRLEMRGEKIVVGGESVAATEAVIPGGGSEVIYYTRVSGDQSRAARFVLVIDQLAPVDAAVAVFPDFMAAGEL